MKWYFSHNFYVFPRCFRDFPVIFVTLIFISALLNWQDYMVGLFKKRNYLKRIFLQISRFYGNIDQSNTAVFYWSFPFLGARILKRNKKIEMTKVIVCDCPKYHHFLMHTCSIINLKLKRLLFYYDIHI